MMSNDANSIDFRLFRERDHLTSGATALHSMDPAEMCMRIEEAEEDEMTLHQGERMALCSEILNGFIEYLFADGVDPVSLQQRIEGFLRSFGGDEFVSKLKGLREWVDTAAVRGVIKKYSAKLMEQREGLGNGALSVWYADLLTEPDQACVHQCLSALVDLMVSEGHSWRLVTAMGYSLAKVLRPQIIAGMSLEDIAILCGDEGGRATPCDRNQRVYNMRVAAAGMKATHVHYQKSEAAVEKYRQAQRGNRNRRKRDARRYGKKSQKKKL